MFAPAFLPARESSVGGIADRASGRPRVQFAFWFLARCGHPRYEQRPSLPFSPSGGLPVKQLIAYLLDHAILDFSGDLTLDMVRDFLREDDSSEARALLGKLVEDRGVDDMIVTLADCLQDYLRTGLSDDVVREQLRLYSES